MQPSFWHIFGLKSSWAVNHFFHVIYCAYNPEAFVHIFVQKHPSTFVTLTSPKASSAAHTRGKSSGEAAVSACEAELRTCLRCGSQYSVEDNSPVACRYHGHMTGELPRSSHHLLSTVRPACSWNVQWLRCWAGCMRQTVPLLVG